jgi:hypothetical protein
MVNFEWVVVLTASVLVAALVGFYAGVARRTQDPPTVRVTPKVAATPLAQPVPAPPPSPEKTAAPAKTAARATFRLTAARGDSWLQVRSGSFTGRTLYEGVLPLGETVRLRSQRLWIRFGGASHLDLFINGKRARLPAFGTFDAFAGPRGVVADRTDYATAAQSP